MRLNHTPASLAIPGPQFKALRDRLHAQVSGEAQAFWRDRRNELQRMEKREQELAQRRQEIETRHAAALLKKRKRLEMETRAAELLKKQKRPRTIDWTRRDFEAEAARKLRDQNRRKLNHQFGPKVFLDRLVPHLCEFASNMAMFERAVLLGLPLSQRQAHMQLVVAQILETIFPRTPAQDPPPPKTRRVQVSEEKKRAGEVIAGPFEILEDSGGRPLGWRRALYAERRGEFENLPIGDLWGLLRAMKKERQLLRRTLKARLVSELLQMAEDPRSRAQMVEDCREKHGVRDRNIAEAARVSRGDFYKWRIDNPRIGPEKSRRILHVICSPVWPPPKI